MADFSRNLAVIIGVNQYDNGIPPLATAVNDAKKLAEILRLKHEYEVTLLIDEAATLENIKRLLEETLPKQVTADDRLLFYFAGHGIALNGEDGPEGFLIPQDAEMGKSNSYFPMTELQDALSDLTCRHFLGLLDCCFAGAFRWSSTRDIGVVPEVIHKERYDRFIVDPAWQVITSAASDQKAADSLSLNTERGQVGENSPFAAALIEALKGQADAYPPSGNGKPPGDGVITATELYLYLRDAVEPSSEGNGKRQTPGIWPLKKHDKGEYIFLAPGHPLNLPPAPPLDESRNPYRGLESFDEEHSALFFGRTTAIAKLYEFVNSQTLTVVLGASGSGKSSLVKAGLVSYLRQQLEGESSQQWQILAPFRPGESPLKALNNTLAGENLAGDSITQLDIEEKVATLSTHLAAWSQQHPQTKMLLIIDQFEELITLCKDDQERENFLTLLAQTVAKYPGQLRLVLTLRSDFEPQFRDTALKEYWNASRFVVSPMTRADLREAIEKPAEARVMYFDPHELVEQLIDEVADMPGALPLLSFGLSELYLKYLKRQREAENGGETIDRSLTKADYQDLGGVIQSLTQRADEEYGALVKEDPAYAQIIRQVMLRMVAIGGGELARRRVPLSELEYPLEKNGLVKEVIELFTKVRLLVKGEDMEGNPYVEPAHDALVRGWKRLLEWKQEEGESLLLQRRLTPAAQEWESVKSKEQPSGFQAKAEPVIDWLDRKIYVVENLFNKTSAQLVRLLRRKQNQQERSGEKPVDFLWNANPYLDVLDKELKSDDNWLNQVEAEFVQESVLQKRQNISWRWRIAIAVMLGLSGLTITALIFLGLSRINEAKTLRESAEINLQKNQSLDGIHDSLEAGKILNPIIKLLLLITEPHLQEQVRGTLLRAIYTVRELDRLPQNPEDQGKGTVRADFSPDGTLLASAGENCDVPIRVWDLQDQTGQTLSKSKPFEFKDKPDNSDNFYHSQSQCEPVKIARFSPDGKLLAAAGAKGTVGVWNVRRKDKELTMSNIWNTGQGEVKSISFSRDGKLLATTRTTGKVLIWNLDNLPKKPEKLDEIPVSNLCNNEYTIWSVAFSRDGTKLAVTGDKGAIGLWDREENKLKENKNTKFPIPKCDEEDYDVTSVNFSPNGQKLVTAGTDDIIRVWDLQGKESVKKIPTNQNKIWEVLFSWDGKKLASAGEDGTVRLWDFNKLKELEKFEGHHGPVRSVSFSRNDQELASAGDDGTVRLWNLQGNESESKKAAVPMDASTDNQIKVLIDNHIQKTVVNKVQSSHVGKVNSFMLIPDRRQFASGGEDRTIRLWDFNGKQKSLLPTYAKVNDLAYSPNQHLLASAGEDGTVQLWNLQDLQEGKPFAAWKAYHSSVKKVSFSPDDKGKVLITVVEDSTDSTTWLCKLWPIESFDQLMKQADEKVNPVNGYLEENSQKGDRHLCDGIGTPVPTPTSPEPPPVTPLDPKAAKEISELKGHQGSVRSVAFSPNGQTLATTGEDGTIRLWNTQGQPLSQFKGNQTAIRSINFSPDGQQLVSDADGKIRLWYLQGQLLREFDGQQKLIRSVQFSPNGQQLASTGDDGTIHLWNLQGHSFAKWQADQKRVWDLAFSPDGQQLASAEAGGSVSLWNMQGKSLHRFTGHLSPVLSVAFSPNGKQLVSGCNVGMIRSWGLLDYQMTNMFHVNHAELNSVAYSPDGKVVISGDNEGNIKMWKLNTQQQSPVWTAHQNSIIRKVAFSPDSKIFATAADDGIVKLWQLE